MATDGQAPLPPGSTWVAVAGSPQADPTYTHAHRCAQQGLACPPLSVWSPRQSGRSVWVLIHWCHLCPICCSVFNKRPESTSMSASAGWSRDPRSRGRLGTGAVQSPVCKIRCRAMVLKISGHVAAAPVPLHNRQGWAIQGGRGTLPGVTWGGSDSGGQGGRSTQGSPPRGQGSWLGWC